MQHRRGIHHPRARVAIALSLLLAVFIVAGALMTINPAPQQQPIEKELDAKAFLESGR